MIRIVEFIDSLVQQYNYKKLPKHLSEEVREQYRQTLPKELLLADKTKVKLYSREGTLVSIGYDDVITGDYDSYTELNESQIVHDNITVKKGQEYRYEPRYNYCKYYWLTAKDSSDIKIYLQKNTVVYADYKIGKYYISPYELVIS